MKEPKLNLGLSERVLTALSLLIITLLLAASGWMWRWDQLLYDLQIDLWSKPPAEDIVIVGVDEKSLVDFGRWPWPRGLHAQLIDVLTEAGARVIAMDILFAESDRHGGAGDRQLIQSVAASGRVFFPVIMEEYRLGGQLVETMPMPELAIVATGLGHMHMDLDADGIARGIFLYEGLGQAYWPHMMLSVLNWLEPAAWPLQNRRGVAAQQTQSISRNSYHLIPFTGPPGHYPRYSYSQVLKGDFLPGAFKDRIVLVGVTATGLGDVLPTPVSAQAKPMPGVEINANILDLLRSGETITRIGMPGVYFATGLLVLLPFFLYPYFPTRLVPVVTVVLMLLVLIATLVLLHQFRLWYPPAVAVLGLLVSYPIWSQRRLDLTVTYLKHELQKLSEEQQVLPVARQPTDLISALSFLEQFMPIQGYAVYDNKGRLMHHAGERLEAPYLEMERCKWQRQGAELWTEIQHNDEVWTLGLSWPRTGVPEGRALQLLEDFAAQFDHPRELESTSTLEQVERRIQQVQQANARLSQLRSFISVTLGQMDDGLLVINSLGRVVLSNPRAAHYLGQGEETELQGREARGLLQTLEVQGEYSWDEIMARLFVEGQPVRFEAKGPDEMELYLQVQPLDEKSAGMLGMIINLSNITALKQAERTRTKMLNFLSHDIRSPITSLLSLTQSRLVTEGTTEELVKKIQPLARRSLKMADDFLQLARAESADAASFSDTEFVAVIFNAMDDVYEQAHLRGIKLLRQLEVDDVWIQGNVALLERALLNLLGNAIKFSPDNGVVSVRLVRGDAWLECCVQDQGPGVPSEQRDQIFLPFRQAEQQGDYQRTGVGLGLSFVKIVAEKHNGSIELRESGQNGSQFCLRLPCEEEAD